ncbi:MAG: CRISPR-associated helicase Cas3' [Crenarchaeota archaeon]|nr:CRISPR-associated helicase Cas3' [Thermoproteota archaeon]
MSSLLEVYNNLLLSKGFFEQRERRQLIEYALDLLEKTAKEGGVLFLQLPTGYGKTAITFTSFFHAIINPESFWRVIHVSPLRSIIDDIYKRTMIGYEKVLANISRDDHRETLVKAFNRYVGAQMMLSPGSPYLQKRLTITTFDTFSISLAKIPVREVSEIARGIGYGHFDVPRASILESLVVMDEIHSFLSEVSRSKALEVLTSIILYLVECRNPLTLMSATMPKTLVKNLLGTLKSLSGSFYYRELYYGDDGVVDKDWENEQINKSIETYILRCKNNSIDSIINKALELSSSCNRVLVVLNTIRRALQVYRRLKEELESHKLILLHSKFKRADRNNKLNAIGEKEKWLLVSTQVIESGVDISANALITDAAPANNLVQRAGRVARKSSDKDGVIIIVEDAEEVNKGFGIYDCEVLKTTLEELERHVAGSKVKISWRSLDHNDYIGYQKFVDKVYSKRNWLFYPDEMYYRLVSSFEWSPSDAIDFLIKLYDGSFLRDSPQIPLIVGSLDEPEGGKDYMKLIENSIPVSLEDIERLLRKGVVIYKLMDRGIEELKPRDLSKLTREVVLRKVIALHVPESSGVYTSEDGLIV